MNIHKNLEWEARQRARYNKYVPIMNRMTYDLEKALGKEVWREMYYKVSYALVGRTAITFHNLDRHEVTIIKNVFGINEMKKDISENYVTLSTTLDNDVEVSFTFGLPASCKVEKEILWEDEQNDESYRIRDGRVQRKTYKVTNIECGEQSMMKALFGEEV